MAATRGARACVVLWGALLGAACGDRGSAPTPSASATTSPPQPAPSAVPSASASTKPRDNVLELLNGGPEGGRADYGPGPHLPTVSTRSIEVTGPLAKEDVERRMKSKHGLFGQCFAKLLAGHPSLEATVALHFVVDATGAPTKAKTKVTPEGVGNSAFDACLVHMLADGAFAKPDGAVTIDYVADLGPPRFASSSGKVVVHRSAKLGGKTVPTATVLDLVKSLETAGYAVDPREDGSSPPFLLRASKGKQTARLVFVPANAPPIVVLPDPERELAEKDGDVVFIDGFVLAAVVDASRDASSKLLGELLEDR